MYLLLYWWWCAYYELLNNRIRNYEGCMHINIMKIINTNSSSKDSFKNSILFSLHYYDVNHHPERIPKWKPFEEKYNFRHNTPNEFEIDNPSISLIIFNENNEIIHSPNNNSNTKAKIIKISEYRYASINKTIKK